MLWTEKNHFSTSKWFGTFAIIESHFDKAKKIQIFRYNFQMMTTILVFLFCSAQKIHFKGEMVMFCSHPIDEVWSECTKNDATFSIFIIQFTQRFDWVPKIPVILSLSCRSLYASKIESGVSTVALKLANQRKYYAKIRRTRHKKHATNTTINIKAI